jgi:SAM-dependent methyltransferase
VIGVTLIRLQEDRPSPTLNSYLEAEWNMFQRDVSRRDALINATKGIRLKRVLDIGCGAGQELLPFVILGARAVGVDVSTEAAQFGRAKLVQAGFGDGADFLTASGSDLPFAEECFDVLICRVALMYMDQKAALSEAARVMRTGGRFLLKYHARSYYVSKFWSGLSDRDPKSSVHALRVLASGYIYHFTGRQPTGRLTAGGEIFQTRESLRREFTALGLKIIGDMPDSNNQTPSLVITKE